MQIINNTTANTTIKIPQTKVVRKKLLKTNTPKLSTNPQTVIFSFSTGKSSRNTGPKKRYKTQKMQGINIVDTITSPEYP